MRCGGEKVQEGDLRVERVKEGTKGFEAVMTSDIQVNELVLLPPLVSAFLEGRLLHLISSSVKGGSIMQPAYL